MSAIDLRECEQEPIHMPGAIQGHGALVVVDRGSDVVIAASENCGNLLGSPEHDLLGQPWQPHCEAWKLVESQLPVGPETRTWQRTLSDHEFCVHGHQAGDLLFYEFEPVLDAAADAPVAGPWTRALNEKQPINIFRASQLLAEEISPVCAYDRVMVYRFLPDWSGEVVAEVRPDEMLPFLGLRYPASDIPAQARDLYRRNPCRVIVDVNAIDVPLKTVPGLAPVDCSHCRLRSVSPYHLEYLRNMGVAAAMSCSIFNPQGELWGLVVCHHRRPRALAADPREYTVRLAREFGAWMAEQERSADQQVGMLRQLEARAMTSAFDNTDSRQLLQRLMMGRFSLPTAFAADGAAVVVGDDLAAMGRTPDTDWIRRAARWLEEKAEVEDDGHQYHMSHHQSAALPPSTAACGLLAGVVRGSGGPLVLMCFRSEIQQEVYWGGDPTTPVVRDRQQRLGPRKSFDLWRETVRGQSRPWGERLAQRLQTLSPLVAAALPEKEGSTALADAMNELVTVEDERFNVAELALRATREGIAVVDSRHRRTPRIIHANAGIFDLFGVDPLLGKARDLRDQMLAAGVSEEALDAPSARFECWTAGRGHRVLESERRPALALACRSGERVWSTVHLKDITLDHRLMQAMVVARDQARQATGAQADLLSNMSHEMRTPLNAVIGFSDVLKDDEALNDEDRKEYVGYIHDAGKHLLDLVNNLLEIARIEGGRLPIMDEEIVDLSTLLTSTLGWLQPIADKHSVRLEPLQVTIDGSTRLHGDPQRLRQVAINLISNAIKFSPPNGSVRTVLGQEPGDAIYFDVIDDGIGIPETQLQRLFERFHRVEDKRTKGVEGTGLGLFLAKALCELHGGTINIDSKEGRGTRVRVTLPANRRSMAET